MNLMVLAALLTADSPDANIIPAGAKLEKMRSDGAFTEGPAYVPGGCVYFSDIGITPDPHEGNRIVKYDPATGKATVYRSPSGRANGLDFDPDGRLIAAEGADAGGTRRVTRTEKDGAVVVLADRWMCKKLNRPNNATADTKGRIYFSDPRYFGDEPRDIDSECVYRIDPDAKLTQLITDMEKLNGVILSPEMKTLYVAEANPKGKQQLLAYPLHDDGGVGAKKVLYDSGKDRGIDGMVVDANGNIYAAAGEKDKAGVCIFSPEGKQLGFIPTPETPTNCVFGDKERKSLCVTAGKSLYRIKLNAEGFAVYWPKEE
ncbi:MAG TPA: SMP-30/gluconolactonase/LRE family protein [Gemmataceae bacterium]|nr:SMP-30/gluconolactonase/LRE family protein [Gemmataceae bacterium]